MNSNPPGQGQSKKARQRRNRQNNKTTTTVTTTNTPNTTRTVALRSNRRRDRNPRVRMIDPYVATLEDPERVSGVKCPGPTAVPTGTFQLTQDLLITSDASGYAGVAVNPMGSQGGGIGTVSISSSTAGVVTWAAGTTIGSGTTAVNLYDHIRCVSGCIKVEYVGNSNVDGGMSTGWWDSLQANNAGANFVAHLNGASGAPGQTSAFAKAYSASFPIRNGMCIRWRPMDFTSYAFINTITTATINMPYIAFQLYGVQASTQCAKVRIIFNYEGIAANDQGNFVRSTYTPTPLASSERAASWGQDLTSKITPAFQGMMSEYSQKAIQYAQAGLNNLANNSRFRDYAIGSAVAGLTGLYSRYGRSNQSIGWR